MSFSKDAFWTSELDEHEKAFRATREKLKAPFDQMLAAAVATINSGNKILFFGNGGSAADSQHLATELAIRYKKDRKPIAAIALTTDTSALTAGGNDFGFDKIFSRQVEAIGKKGDMAIAISTSGNSPNILAAIAACKDIGITVAGFTGETGGKMAGICDILINVPSPTTARIQEMHLTLGHMLCGALELELGLVAA